jgi:hypothetical protein
MRLGLSAIMAHSLSNYGATQHRTRTVRATSQIHTVGKVDFCACVQIRNYGVPRIVPRSARAGVNMGQVI